jgi:2-phospho-L-lactate guanylyltransferase
MRVLAVPVKPLERVKSRLAPILSPVERSELTMAMYEDVLQACVLQSDWRAWVVSRSPDVLDAAERRGARAIEERGRSLAEAIRQTESGLDGERDELAVVLADLPFLSSSTLAAALRVAASVVAAPASSDGGTNLLVRRPASAIRSRFGRSSFAKHRWAARRAGAPFEAFVSPELGFDLDRPEDLVRVVGSDHPGRTRAVCVGMGLPDRLRRRA